MNLADDRRKAMRYEYPQRIPVSVSFLPATWMKCRRELDALVRRHPLVFPNYKGKERFDEIGTITYHTGDHTDEWGCVWSNVHEGMEAIVTGHPVPTREAVRTLKPPANPREIDAHIKECVVRLGSREGGLWLAAECAPDVPLENIEAIATAMEKHSTYWSR